MMRFNCLLLVAAWLSAPRLAPADPVVWTVDSTASYLRLSIPDQSVAVPNVGNVLVRFRDAGDTGNWSDAGGRRAALAGQILTDYQDGVSIAFRGGEHNLYALEQTLLRPNPAAWDAANTNYSNTTTALAALGARIRGTISIFTVDLAFLAFRQVGLDLANAVAGPIPLVNGVVPAGATQSGIARTLADVDGLTVLTFGQPIPDIYHGEMNPGLYTNNAGATITNTSPVDRKLTYTLSLTNMVVDLNGTSLTGSVAGLIVAYTTLPPTLGAARQGGNIVLSWTTNATGYTLQSSTNLATPFWTTANPPPTILGNRYVVTNAAAGPAAYYRLRKP